MSCLTETNVTIAKEMEKSFRRICGTLIKSAYDAIQDVSRFDTSWHEDEFTREMVKHMNEINEAGFHYPLSIHWDEKGKTSGNLDTEEHPNTAQRVDITLNRVRHSGTIEYYVECKRIRTDESKLMREYWKSGVRRYVDCEYADEYSFAAMAAYVLYGDLDENAEELQKRSKYYQDRMRLKDRWEFNYSEEGMKVYLTKHERNGLQDIQIDHHLLDFT